MLIHKNTIHKHTKMTHANTQKHKNTQNVTHVDIKNFLDMHEIEYNDTQYISNDNDTY